jgi:dTDP-glucose pyrophosphorylase
VSIDIESMLVPPEAPIRRVMECIDGNMTGLALIVDGDRRLLATVTDGDLRRAVLGGVDLDGSISLLLADRSGAVTAGAGTGSDALLRLMEERDVRHVPLLDVDGRVVDVALLTELVKDYRLPLKAVVMAGGFGARLGNLTAETPKPMLPIAERPLLELIVGQLRDAGIGHVAVTTHYLPETIRQHFGDGSAFGVEIHYVDEREPLGTAGGLGLLTDSDEPVLVMNGDVLTRIDIRSFVAFHEEHRAAATVAVLPYELRIPYGVVEISGVAVAGITEKPLLRRFVNAGIYLLSPAARRMLPRGERYDMTDLIARLVAEGCQVVAFPLREYWLDIGETTAYEQANRDARLGR